MAAMRTPRHPGWLARLLRWCSARDAAWLALGQRTHTQDWWAGA
jgi:hypothetical protein